MKKPNFPPLNRRQFLGTAAVLAATPVLGNPLALRAATPAWALRLSASSINYSKLSIEEACQRIGRLGFEGVDIWSAYTGCPHLDDGLKRLGPDGLKTLLAKHRLRLNAFSVYVGGYARYAELLGQSGGGVAIQGSAGPCPAHELRRRMKQFIESLKPALELCERYNSQLAIENHGHALLDSIDSIKAFVDLNTHPRLGIALAPYHLQILGASVEEAIVACGPQLLFFYAWQHAPGTQQLPGLGKADFVPWLRALARINYRGYVNPFMHEEPAPEAMDLALAQSRDYLKKCYAEM